MATRLLRLPPALAAAAERALAPSTWRARTRVLRALLGPDLQPVSARRLRRRTVRYLEACLASKPKSAASEVGQVRQAWALAGHILPPDLAATLTLIQRGARRQTAAVPITKALPMRDRDLRCLLNDSSIPRAVRLAILLARKGGARVDDVCRLRPGAVQALQGREVLVMYGVTKTNPTAEARADHQVILRSRRLARWVRKYGWTAPAKAAVRRALDSVTPSRSWVRQCKREAPLNSVRHRYTLHSLKRAKARELWKEASEGGITVHTVMHTLKHASLRAALAYCPCPAWAARACARNPPAPTQ